MKRFYGNTFMSRVLKNTLRVVALLCVLFGSASSALATYYIDARDYILTGKSFSINWLQDASSNTISYTQVETGVWSCETLFAKAEFNANGQNTKYGPGQEGGALPTLSGSNNCYLINANGKPTAAAFSGTTGGGGSTGGDTGGSTGGDTGGGSTGGGTTGDCSKVIIYCRGNQQSYTDMYCYTWDTNNTYIKTQWPGKTADRKETYNGHTYAVWEFDNDIAGVLFNNGSDNCKTGDYTSQTLSVGNMYVFDLAYNNNSWCSVPPTLSASEKINCDPDDPDDPIEYTTPVILSRDAVVDEDNLTATLYGYMQGHPNETTCTNIQYYGFAFCEGQNCIPTTTASDCGDFVHADASHNGENLVRGKEFSATLSASCGNLQEGKVYGYRAYVWDGKAVLSDETRYFATKGGCIPIPGGGDTIRVTVDAAEYFANDTTKFSDCNLRYGNLHRALSNLKSNREYVDANGNLLQPIIITVANVPTSYNKKEDCDKDVEGVKEKTVVAAYKGVEKTVSGGDNGGTRDLDVMAIEGFNKNKTTGYHPLIIKAKKGHTPRIQHLLIRSSRGVVLDGLGFYSNANDCGKEKDTALEIDNGKCSDWTNVVNDFSKANIVIKNCVVGSNGFTGAHITGYDGITFENNIFNLSTTDISDNAAAWGASVKFFECKNIKFVRNNLMGEHGTLIWLQQTQNVLIYNNVFWNTNQYNEKCMGIRIYKQFDKTTPGNIACLYNTFYLADNSKNAKQYDFLGSKDDSKGISGKITFLYNNCYSYDTDVPGAAKVGLDKFTGTKNFCPNNFWSVYDVNNKKSKSVFQFADCTNETNFINVANLVCETSASGPSSLVVREASSGDGLKVGKSLTASDIQGYVGSDIEVTNEELKHDRNHDNVRKGSKWTLGAFEASASNEVKTIYWVGSKDSNWDDRNNWRWLDSNGKPQPLTCVDNLNSDLKVIIGEYGSTKYPSSTSGKYSYPVIPSSFDPVARKNATKVIKDGKETFAGIPAAEQVAAGRGFVEPTKYATSIELEYGAAIAGVENLVDGETRLYDEAYTHLTVPRSEWLLVGSIIKPWTDDTKSEVRYIKSNDYYLHHFPHVYMHKAKLNDARDGADWDTPFADLNVDVKENESYAINVADEYGEYKVPADYYYTRLEKNEEMVNDGTKTKTFDFNGRFLHESSPLNLGILTAETTYLFCNTYPANIDIAKFKEKYKGTVQIYNYSTGGFSGQETGTILSQHGFVFTPANDVEVVLDDMSLFNTSSSTRVEEYATLTMRSSKVVLPKFRLNVTNINAPRATDVLIKVDSEKPDMEDYATDAPKVFNNSDNKVPEIYVMRYDKKWASMVVPNMEEPIPLGVRTSRKNVSIRFSISDMRGIASATLEDRMLGVTYNLGTEDCVVESLPKGETEGRFFLNLKAIEPDSEERPEVDGDEVTTEVDDISSERGISIIGNSEGIIVSSSSDINLQTIYVNDMSGRTAKYLVSGHFAEIKLPVAQSVYTVSVVGDTASKTGKVIIK